MIFEVGGGFVQDCFIYEDIGIFVKMYVDKGIMLKIDYKIYISFFEVMVMILYFLYLDVLIYLEGDLENILNWIEECGCEMEFQISWFYWEEMYICYENWISGFNVCFVLKFCIEDYDLLNDESLIENIVD